jgi:hypothetical protein
MCIKQFQNTAKGYGVFNSTDMTGEFLNYMCVSAMVSCRTCETSHFGASCSPTTSRSNFLLGATNFVISSTDILTTGTHQINATGQIITGRKAIELQVHTLPFMFHVMMRTQSTELVVNSQAFWIGIVFMPS